MHRIPVRPAAGAAGLAFGLLAAGVPLGVVALGVPPAVSLTSAGVVPLLAGFCAAFGAEGALPFGVAPPTCAFPLPPAAFGASFPLGGVSDRFPD